MRKLSLGLVALISVATSATAFNPGQGGGQAPAAPTNHSDEIVLKLRQADLMVQLTPLALTKDQINKLMATLEKIRADQAKIRKQEDDILLKMEPELDKVLKAAIETGAFPPRPFIESTSKTTAQMTLTRAFWSTKMVDQLLETIKKSLDAGQIKAMTHSLNAEALDPTKKMKDMNDEDKLKFFIARIFLDDVTYDLLGKMAKAK